MLLKKNIRVGKTKFYVFFIILILSLIFSNYSNSKTDLEGKYTNIKVLDKMSSKNILLKLKNGKEIRHKDLLIRSMKCKNSEFDDDPEITAYIQVKDLNISDNEKVFVFNGWTFSSSPTLNPFDHPVYDLWLSSCKII